MALVVIDNDPWLDEYDMCEKLHRDILDLLNKRSVELKTSDDYARLSSSIRIRLKQFDVEVEQLSHKLREATMSRAITLDEAERRERLTENLRTKSIHMQRRFNDRDTMSKTNRSELLDDRYGFSNNKLSKVENSGWSSVGDDDAILPENPTMADMAQLRLQQRSMMEEQDAGLEELSKTISRQKNIAIKIGDEVNVHNDILDDISDRMERTVTGLQRGTDQINVFSRKEATCGYWIIIILLFIAIVVVILS
ncbi:syntaxin-8 [Planococcus citri]|uniref:syntaxin-8 n=1 Tax=Planococcus citri TaxID=170843 RepID=UPI0031F87A2F